MKPKYLLLPAALAILSTGCTGPLTMPLVGIGKNGEVLMQRVNSQGFSGKMTECLETMNDSVVPALQSEAEKNASWKLRSVTVGFGVNIGGGVGPFKAGVTPRIRAAFATGEKPPIP